MGATAVSLTNSDRFMLIDHADLHIVEGKSLRLRPDGYIETKQDGKSVLVHRLIMLPPKGKVVDHINHDKSDNTRGNLRVCTYYENSQNRLIYDKECVYLTKGAYQASVQVKLLRHYLGRFKTKEEALNAVKAFKNKIRQETTNLSEAQGFSSGAL